VGSADIFGGVSVGVGLVTSVGTLLVGALMAAPILTCYPPPAADA
jgi:hypothetical protein